jgi:uncharacterized membrane protein (UPF0127 family)
MAARSDTASASLSSVPAPDAEGKVALENFLKPLFAGSTTGFQLRNSRTQLSLAANLEVAFEAETRKRGLLGRDSLPPSHAMIIAPSNLVHTFFMRFPIDIAFVRRDGTVSKVRTSVPARRIVGALRAYAVIELAAGELSRSRTAPGDRLEVVRS